jgi:hypothetical protein
MDLFDSLGKAGSIEEFCDSDIIAEFGMTNAISAPSPHYSGSYSARPCTGEIFDRVLRSRENPIISYPVCGMP